MMSTELQDDKSPGELAALWKTIPKSNIVEHRSDLYIIFLEIKSRVHPGDFHFRCLFSLLAQRAEVPSIFVEFLGR